MIHLTTEVTRILTGMIKFGDTSFVPSIYQESIFDNIEHGVGDMIIKASAGSAKTTTLVNCINIIPKTKRILFIAFNKDIVETIKRKLGNPDNATICTFHSLGRSIFCENNGYIRENQLNEFKYKNYIEHNLPMLTDESRIASLGKGELRTYINNITSLVDFSRHALVFRQKEILNVADKYGITPIYDEPAVVRKVLKWGKENLDTIDFTDMIWLPNVLNMLTRKNLYDWILIDEAQDITIAQQQLVSKCYKRGCRVIAAGDENQRINIWAGSDEYAIETFKERYGEVTKYFQLPISYRCPKKVIKLANEILSSMNRNYEIITPDKAIEGEIRYDVSKFDPSDGDMVLCRITAPLIALHLEYLKNNKHSYVRGYEEIQKNYTDIITSAEATSIDKKMRDRNGLFVKLYERLIRMTEYNMETYMLSEEDAVSNANVISFYDAILAIEVLSEGVDTVEELLQKINDVFTAQTTDGVQLTTVHKAKGLEADNVYILKYSIMPMKHATKEWEKISEENLRYVAVTRAIKTLNFIKEDDFYKKGQRNDRFDVKDIIKEMDKVREFLGLEKGQKEEDSTNNIINFLVQSGETLPTKKFNKNIDKKINNFIF